MVDGRLEEGSKEISKGSLRTLMNYKQRGVNVGGL